MGYLDSPGGTILFLISHLDTVYTAYSGPREENKKHSKNITSGKHYQVFVDIHRIAKQLTFSNGIPFIFFGHFILVLRFPSSREFQFEICFARSFLCFLNYTLQHHWICVRSLDPYKLMMFWSPLDLRLRCKFTSAKQISNRNSRDEGNLETNG